MRRLRYQVKVDWGKWLAEITRTCNQQHGRRSSEGVEYTPKYLGINAERVDFPSSSNPCGSFCYVFSDRNVYLALNTFSAGYTKQQSY